MSSYGASNEVERGTMQTITKLGVSIVLVLLMLMFSFYENSLKMSILLCLLSPFSLTLSARLDVLRVARVRYGSVRSVQLTPRSGSFIMGWTPVDHHHARHHLLSAGPRHRQHGPHHHHVLPRG